MVLCTECKAIFSGERKTCRRGEPIPEAHHTKETFYAANRGRCRICSKLFRQFTDFHPEFSIVDLSSHDPVTERILYDSGEESYLAPGCLEIAFIPSELLKLERGLTATFGYRNRAMLYRKFRLIPRGMMDDIPVLREPGPSSTSSGTTFETVTTWIRNCEETHTLCAAQRSSVSEFWPTRILDVADESIGEEYVRLVEFATSWNHYSIKYVTLSHRWGQKMLFQLHSKNLDQLKQAIRIEALPATFRHAVEVVRRLGLRYLWIDALCIIQDSEEDWQREAAQMSMVYRNSYCNLAATDSHYSINSVRWFVEHGLFHEHDDEWSPALECIDADWTNAENGEYFIFDSGFFEFDWIIEPLNARAWVVQESLLSPRVLHFHRQQVFWQCHELSASETFPDGFPPSNVVGTRLTRISTQGSEDPLLKWMRIVELYSRCQMTYDKDKLVAICGIAESLASKLGEGYVAGLWRRDLVIQLLWSVEVCKQSSGMPSIRIESPAAPTWSWASLHGSIDYPKDRFSHRDNSSTDLVKVIEMTAQRETNNEYDKVKHGIVKLSGWLYRHPRLTTGQSMLSTVRGFSFLEDRTDRSIHMDLPSDIDDETLAGLWFLPMKLSYNLDEVIGLILQPFAQDTPAEPTTALNYPTTRGTYQRVGFFHVTKADTVEYFKSSSHRNDLDILYLQNSVNTLNIV